MHFLTKKMNLVSRRDNEKAPWHCITSYLKSVGPFQWERASAAYNWIPEFSQSSDSQAQSLGFWAVLLAARQWDGVLFKSQRFSASWLSYKTML